MAMQVCPNSEPGPTLTATGDLGVLVSLCQDSEKDRRMAVQQIQDLIQRHQRGCGEAKVAAKLDFGLYLEECNRWSEHMASDLGGEYQSSLAQTVEKVKSQYLRSLSVCKKDAQRLSRQNYILEQTIKRGEKLRTSFKLLFSMAQNASSKLVNFKSHITHLNSQTGHIRQREADITDIVRDILTKQDQMTRQLEHLRKEHEEQKAQYQKALIENGRIRSEIVFVNLALAQESLNLDFGYTDNLTVDMQEATNPDIDEHIQRLEGTIEAKLEQLRYQELTGRLAETLDAFDAYNDQLMDQNMNKLEERIRLEAKVCDNSIRDQQDDQDNLVSFFRSRIKSQGKTNEKIRLIHQSYLILSQSVAKLLSRLDKIAKRQYDSQEQRRWRQVQQKNDLLHRELNQKTNQLSNIKKTFDGLKNSGSKLRRKERLEDFKKKNEHLKESLLEKQSRIGQLQLELQQKMQERRMVERAQLRDKELRDKEDRERGAKQREEKQINQRTKQGPSSHKRPNNQESNAGSESSEPNPDESQFVNQPDNKKVVRGLDSSSNPKLTKKEKRKVSKGKRNRSKE